MYIQLHKNKKLDVIAHSLTRSGIPLWNGIPEQIVKDLHAAGYKIKKRKRYRHIKQDPTILKIPAKVLHDQHESTNDIYL